MTYINQLLLEKQCLYSSLLNQAHQNKTTTKTYKEIKGTLQRELRHMKNEWWSNISKEVQKASDSKDANTLSSLLNQVFGPTSSLVTPLKSKDNTTLIKEPKKSYNTGKNISKIYSTIHHSVSDIVIDTVIVVPQLETRNSTSSEQTSNT